MVHFFVESFGDEIASFRVFAKSFPDHTVILVDTYDSVSGLRREVEGVLELKALGASSGGDTLGLRGHGGPEPSDLGYARPGWAGGGHGGLR
jgi:nicotinic acid phosphoribosyltransferase